MRASLIFTAKSPDHCADALRALGKLAYPLSDFEVILAIGLNPSAQRNRAASIAKGDYLLFLDSDSVVDPQILRQYDCVLHREPGIGIAGGPALHAPGFHAFRLALTELFSSRFGAGPFRSRYSSEGNIRRATERELILCNLLVKRSLFQKSGGFHTDLYPSEENEFLNRMGGTTKIYYNPRAVCYRDPPESLGAFVGKLLRYGAGRAKHMLLFPRFWKHLYLLPAFFALCVFSLPVLFLWWDKGAFVPGILRGLLFFYVALALFFALRPAFREKRMELVALLPPLFFCCHLAYGAGLLWGFLRHPFLRSRPVVEVRVIRWKGFGETLPQEKLPFTPSPDCFQPAAAVFQA